MSPWSIKIWTSIIAIPYIGNGVIPEERTVLNDRRILCIGVVCYSPADQKSSRKTKAARIQRISVVVESRAVVVMEKAIDEKKLLTLRSCKPTVGIIPKDKSIIL